jgi:hypothetical protein
VGKIQFMKNASSGFIFTLILIAAAVFGAGCGTMLAKTATSGTLPVLSGAATTNDVNAIAYEKYALALNAQYNTSSSEPMIAAIGGAILALTSAASGWYSRHVVAKASTAATLAATNAAAGKT